MSHALNRPARLSAIALSLGVLAASVGLVVAPTPAHAEDFTVTTTADVVDGNCATLTLAGLASAGDGLVSLREAVCLADQAPDADVITLGPGTHVLASELAPNYDLTIVGAGMDETVIDSAGRVIDAFLIDLQLQDLTLNGGDVRAAGPNDGGVLSLFLADAMLRDVRVTGGVATDGGGIASYNSDLILLGVVVDGNQAVGTASNGNGGGVFFASGQLNIQGTTIAGNTAGAAGGGLVVQLNGSDITTIEQSTFSDNSVTNGAGGGLATVQGHSGFVIVSDSTFSGNSASTRGGAINVAGNADNELLALHITATLNTASIGGGIARTAGTASVGNSIVAGNTGGAEPDVTGTVSGTGNILGVATSAIVNGVGSNLAGTAAAPVDPQLGPLSDNGGPTRTHLLLPTSAAIDSAPAGDCNGVDQRGIDRFQGDGCDRGAVELTFPNTWFTSTPPAATASADAALAFSGSGTFGSNDFECSLDSAAFTTCTSPLNLSGLADGPHELRVRALDEFGGVDVTPAIASWTVDTTGPAIAWGAVSLGTTPGSSSTLAFTAADALSEVDGFECSLDGAAFAACTSPVTTPALAVGSHSFRVRAVDELGNVGDAVERSWTVVAATLPDTAPVAAEIADTGTGGLDVAFAAGSALLLAGALLLATRRIRRRA